eukprot:2976678-Lingulodinium_polyedra.AAC.1
MQGYLHRSQDGSLEERLWWMIRAVPGILVTDSKNVFDLMKHPENLLGGRDKRTGLELMGLAQSLEEGATKLRWVHSDAMLANSLTKKGERWQLENYLR